MKTNQVFPEAISSQWQKPMFSFYNYVPMKYKATQKEWDVRKFIWNFKEGRQVMAAARMVAEHIREQFGSLCDTLCFACIPAHTPELNEARYMEFSREVCRLTGAANAYDHIHVEGDRLAVHEYGHQEKEFSSCSVISFDRDFFNGKRVILFDDIITRGLSYARFAAQLEFFGAEVMGGVFLGKTLLN